MIEELNNSEVLRKRNFLLKKIMTKELIVDFEVVDRTSPDSMLMLLLK